MRVLVFGKTGQVGRELARQGGEIILLGRDTADFGRPETCAQAIADHAPDAVINAAAYTAVDQAEEEEALATAINGTAPGVIARACADRGLPLVHISTDYVFAGTGAAPHRPDDPTTPLSAYGRSKLQGEAAVRAAGGAHAILRTSWVISAHGSNFVKTMLRVGAARGTVRIVTDQIGGPTPAAAIAQACLGIAAQLAGDADKSGTYHFSGAPDTSWAGLARAVFDAARLDVAIEEIASTDYPTPARRPLNSRLECTRTRETFGIDRPDWREGLSDILEDLRLQGDLT